MRVRVLLFAQIADAIGASEVDVELAPGQTVQAIIDRIGERVKSRPLLDHCAVAVNEQYANRSQPLQDGDVVAIIPPVSGG